MSNVVGLFGTCGKSLWRDDFISMYESEGIVYYNPKVDDWQPEMAQLEADHLANDSVILFPVTSEEYSIGSLSEVGFSVLNAIRLDDRRDFVIMIDQKLDADLTDKAMCKASLTARALVHQHVLKMRLSNLYVVDNLTDMLKVSVALYKSNEIRESVSKFIVHTAR
jgi:hypothetical protein